MVPATTRGVEVAGHVERVVQHDVDLLGAEHHARNAAEETEHHEGHEHACEGRVVPRGTPQPFEDAVGETLLPLRRLDRAGHGHAVDQAAEHRQIESVAGVEHLPFRTQPRLHQEMVGAGELKEQDVHQERRAADLLGERLRAERDRGDRVPDRDMGGDVDLLGGMAHAPPDQLVHQGIDIADQPERPEIGRDQDDGRRRSG